jgi:multidrug efflux system outer membrane protein
MIARILPVALVPLLAADCAVGPDYDRPKVPVSSQYRFDDTKTTAASLVDLPWWQVFRDAPLRALVEEALKKNYDLEAAAARVEVSRAQARAAGAQLLPAVSVGAIAQYGNAFQGGLAAANKSFYAANAVGTASWEVDLWGRLRRAREAARAEYWASEEARRGVWVTLLADVGQSYFQLLSLDTQRIIAEKTVIARSKILDVFRVRAEGGAGTHLDVARAEADLAGAKFTLIDLQRQISLGEDALSLLLGRPPGPIARTAPTGALAEPPIVPAGLPSALLERRPDVRQAEANLVEANAQIGVATANLFPTFSLTALGGIVSTNLAFLQAPNPSGIYSVGGQANYLLPFLQGASLRYQLQASKSSYAAARASYAQTIMTALKDVSDALVTLQRFREARVEEENQVAALQRAVDISRTQFEGGTATYLDVINAEQQRFPAELALAQLEGNALAAYVQLYRALGGGWWFAEGTHEPDGERASPP